MTRISHLLFATLILAGSACERRSNNQTGGGAAGTASAENDPQRAETSGDLGGTTGSAGTTGTTGTGQVSGGDTSANRGGTMGGTTGTTTTPSDTMGHGGTTTGGTTGHGTMPHTGGTPAVMASMNDAQILAMGVMVHQSEIEAAQLMKARSTNKQVQKFAQTMIDDHGKALKAGRALDDKLGGGQKAEDTSMVDSMRSTSAMTLQRLQGLSGQQLDAAYVADRVTTHQHVLDMLEDQMIPNARDPQLKQHLERHRPVIAKHLADAQKLQQSMGTTGTTTGAQGSTGAPTTGTTSTGNTGTGTGSY